MLSVDTACPEGIVSFPVLVKASILIEKYLSPLMFSRTITGFFITEYLLSFSLKFSRIRDLKAAISAVEATPRVSTSSSIDTRLSNFSVTTSKLSRGFLSKDSEVG